MKPKQSLSEAVKPIITLWKVTNPLECHVLGIHDYDGNLPDYRENFIRKRSEKITKDLKQLASVEKEAVQSKLTRLEYNLLRMALQTEFFELKEHQEFKENPLTYIGPLGIIETSYAARSFASV